MGPPSRIPQPGYGPHTSSCQDMSSRHDMSSCHHTSSCLSMASYHDTTSCHGMASRYDLALHAIMSAHPGHPSKIGVLGYVGAVNICLGGDIGRATIGPPLSYGVPPIRKYGWDGFVWGIQFRPDFSLGVAPHKKF